jgi:molybdopterin synthase catalytic subunit
VIQIQVLPFGTLKDRLGPQHFPMELPQGSTVADLLQSLSDAQQNLSGDLASSSSTRKLDGIFRGIAVSVNAEYATATQILANGDEVGLLPPVSGGSDSPEPSGPVLTYLTRDPIPSEALIASARHPDDGAIVVFDGIVRNNTRGRKTLHLDYEAYEEMAARQMDSLAREALSCFGVRQIIMVHRLGRLEVGQTSVLIVVASAHRAQAFEASRWLIDTLKKTVPIWKKETFVDGVVWAAGDPFPVELALAPPEPGQ